MHIHTAHAHIQTHTHTWQAISWNILKAVILLIHIRGSESVRNSTKLAWVKLQKAQVIPTLWIQGSLGDSSEISSDPASCLCPGSRFSGAALAVEPHWEPGGGFHAGSAAVLPGGNCRATLPPAAASSKPPRKSCQVRRDAFVPQNTRQTAINPHLLKLILTCSLTFKGITRHTALLNVYTERSLQEREQR